MTATESIFSKIRLLDNFLYRTLVLNYENPTNGSRPQTHGKTDAHGLHTTCLFVFYFLKIV